LLEEAEHDPILLMEHELLTAGILTEEEAAAIPRGSPPGRGRSGARGHGRRRPDPRR